MVIYNVTVKIEAQIADEWLQWMQAEHLPELMATGLFLKNQICRLLEQNEMDEVTFTVQYFCDDYSIYNRYINEFSPMMREKVNERYKGKFVSFRTVMEIIA
jgi:phage terminase small subunit